MRAAPWMPTDCWLALHATGVVVVGRSTRSLGVMSSISRTQLMICCTLAAAGNAAACDCAIRLKARDAAIAFVGTPTKRIVVTERGVPNSEWPLYTFSVERTITGPNLPKVVVGSNLTDCGIPFEIGHRYTVVARSLPDHGIQWYADQCSETKPERAK